MSFGQSMKINPYIVGVPVPPERFFGYTAHVNKFYQSLIGPVLQPIRILGLRRSGKTSFLLYLSSEFGKTISPYCAQLNDLFLIYIDLQQVQTPVEFYNCVVRKIWEETACLPNRLSPPDEIFNARQFGRWIQGFFDTDKCLRLVILLDEFDKLASESEFDQDFFGLLRSMASASDFSARFTWVTASVKDLHDLSPDRGETDKISPFWNIFLPDPIILGGFNQKEATQLIRKPALSQKVTVSKDEISEICKIAGKLPYMLQAVAREWFETREQKKTIKRMLLFQQVHEELLNLDQIQKLFMGYWKQLTEEQKSFLDHLAQGLPASPIARRARMQLINLGLVEESLDGDRVSGELFRQFILTRQPEARDCMVKPEQVTRPAFVEPGNTYNITVNGNVDSLYQLNNTPNVEKIFSKLSEQASDIANENTRKDVEEALKSLQAEAKKGQKANEDEIQKWFTFLARMAPDMFDVAIATFINPIQGLSTAFKKIAEQASKSK